MTQLTNQFAPSIEQIKLFKKNGFPKLSGKYIFINPFTTRIKTTATGRAAEGEGDGKITITYKKGDIVRGVTQQNTINSEPPLYLVLPNGAHIPFGGRASQFVKEYFLENMPSSDLPDKTKPGNDFPIDEATQNKIIKEIEATANKAKKYLTPKNIVIGAVGFFALVGLIKMVK